MAAILRAMEREVVAVGESGWFGEVGLQVFVENGVPVRIVASTRRSEKL
jgi:hypothetical protein